MSKINIVLYETIDGKCPVKEFINNLDAKMQAKVLRTIDLLEANGTDLREPYSKSIGDGIFELRIKQGSDISRVMYFYFVGNNAVLTHGFVKKTSKTPPNEIMKAKKYRDEYARRERKNEKV